MKKIFLAFLALSLLAAAGIFYLNNVFLPTKAKTLIIQGLQEATQRKVSLGAVRFRLFKGIVLTDLVIYDDTEALLNVKELSCAFLIPPILQKKIIIPSLVLKSPEIFIKRKKDGTFNIGDLISGQPAQSQKAKFGIFVFKVAAIGGRLHFKDDTFAPPFARDIEGADLRLYLSLPAGVKFRFSAAIAPGAGETLAGAPLNISAEGEFRIPEQELAAKISLQNFPPKEFSAYFQGLGVDIGSGMLNVSADLKLKEDTLYFSPLIQVKNLMIAKDRISAELNSDIQADGRYNLKDKGFEFSGKLALVGSRLSGMEIVEAIDNINGKARFDNSGVFSDKLNAAIWGLPVEADFKLTNFNNPLFDINLTSVFGLDSAQAVLKDRLKFAFPAELKGEGRLSLLIRSGAPPAAGSNLSGSLDVLNAALKLEKLNAPFEEINGRLEFDRRQLKWHGLVFKYLGVPYKTGGVLTDFAAPAVRLTLESEDLSLSASLAIKASRINLLEFSGKYLNSEFGLAGSIDREGLSADIAGSLSINLADTPKMLEKYKERAAQAAPQGLMQAQFSINGALSTLKSCAISAKLSSPSLSLWGLKAQDFLLNYNQAGGIADIPLAHFSLYDGALDLSAKINLNSESFPYWLTFQMQGVKIEKLKLDTAAKIKDIAGSIQAQGRLNGFFNDASRLSGEGKILITEGRLWQLNLFQGLGALLFARDFAGIVFSEGSCGFFVRDKSVFTDSLKLKSNIAELSGQARLGFDGSLEASLNVAVLDEAAPLTGTFRDVATAIIGQAGRFGVIKISGTLKEPRYKFQPAVKDIIKGFKDILLGN